MLKGKFPCIKDYQDFEGIEPNSERKDEKVCWVDAAQKVKNDSMGLEFSMAAGFEEGNACCPVW